MEMLTGSVSKVDFYLPTENTVVEDVVFSDGTDEISVDFSVNESVATATLPFLQYEGRVSVSWNILIDGKEFSHTDIHEVATSYIHPRDVMKIIESDDFDEAVRVERVTRHIINSFTHQSFGKREDTLTIEGNGSIYLPLPERLIEINTFDGIKGSHVIDADGWVVRSNKFGIPPLRADFHGWHYATDGVIVSPNSYERWRFTPRKYYTIDGLWGWDFVPAGIVEAAKLLVGDYACGDSVYRDRYLTSMTAADWRIQLNPAAWSRTGNARADALLQDYVVPIGWAVI